MAKALKKVAKSNSSLAKRYMDEIVGRQMNGFYQVLKVDRAVTEPRLACDPDTIRELLAEVERLKSMTAVTMSIGSGDGSLFVHGDYDSIKAAQALVFRAERLAEALRRYGQHDDTCGVNTFGHNRCTCGFSAALHGQEEQK